MLGGRTNSPLLGQINTPGPDEGCVACVNPRKVANDVHSPIHQPDATPPGLISGFQKDATDAQGGVLLCVYIKQYAKSFGQTTGVR